MRRIPDFVVAAEAPERIVLAARAVISEPSAIAIAALEEALAAHDALNVG